MIPCQRRMTPAPQRGMTLVEVLVVLAILAITSSVTLLAIGAGSGMNGQAEAKRLQSRLQLAADRTMLSAEPIAFAASANGYGFVEWNAARGAWQPSRLANLGEAYRLPGGMALQSSDPRNPLPMGADASGQGFTLTLSADQRRWTVSFDGMTARLDPASGAAGS